MPQMAPLNWLTLMIYFLFIFVIFAILNYYSYLQLPQQLKIKMIKTSNNWKW